MAAAQRHAATNAYHRHDSGFAGSFDSTDTETGVNDSLEEVDGEISETEAIRPIYPKLGVAISQQLDVVSAQLYSCELIERSKQDQIRTALGVSDFSKALDILKIVLFKIESDSDPSKQLHNFLHTLEECGIREIAKQIRKNYTDGNEASESQVMLHPAAYYSPNSPSTSRCHLRNSIHTRCLIVFFSLFAISLLLVTSVLLLQHLTVLHDHHDWTLNADMRRDTEKTHPSSVFDENNLMALYNKEKWQLEEQLLIAQRQIIQLNREVLDNRLCTGTCANEPKATCEKQIKRLLEEKMECVAKIEKLTQQRNLLFE